MTKTTLFDEAFLEKMQRYLEMHNLVLVRRADAQRVQKGRQHFEWRERQ